jgi:tetratricopeptide (TPR) repeat protein
LAALGRTEDVNQVIDESLAATSASRTPGDVMREAAAELRAHGERKASLAVAGRAAAWYRERLAAAPDSERWLAGFLDALRFAEQWDEAYAVCRRLTERTPQDCDRRGILGGLAARRGNREEALRISDELRRATAPYLFGANTYRRACIAALLGDKEAAVQLLRESFAEGVPYGVRPHREIDLEPLHGYAPFEEMLKPRG